MNEDIKRLVEALEESSAWMRELPAIFTGDFHRLRDAQVRRNSQALASITSKETEHG